MRLFCFRYTCIFIFVQYEILLTIITKLEISSGGSYIFESCSMLLFTFYPVF